MISRRDLIGAIPALLAGCNMGERGQENMQFEVVDTFSDCDVSPDGTYIAMSVPVANGTGVLILNTRNNTSSLYEARIDGMCQFNSLKVSNNGEVITQFLHMNDDSSYIGRFQVATPQIDLLNLGKGEVRGPVRHNQSIVCFYRDLGESHLRCLRISNEGTWSAINFPPMQTVDTSYIIDDGLFCFGVPGADSFDVIALDARSNFLRTAWSNASETQGAEIIALSKRYSMLAIQGWSNSTGFVFTGSVDTDRHIVSLKDSIVTVHSTDNRITCCRVSELGEIVKFCADPARFNESKRIVYKNNIILINDVIGESIKSGLEINYV